MTEPPPVHTKGPSAESTAEFLWNVHSYLNEYIRFADAKAVVVIAWASALFGALHSADAHHFLDPRTFTLTSPEFWLSLHGIGAFLGFALLTGSFTVAVGSIIPRLWDGTKPGFIFWGNVLRYAGPADFYSALLNEPDLPRHLAEHIYTLARIATTKYSRIAWAIRLAFLGSIAAGLTVLCSA